MRRVRLERALSPGARFAHDVVGTGGEVLARAGLPLTERAVRALAGRGVAWCFVDDRASTGVRLAPLDGGGAAVRAVLSALEAGIAEAVAPLLALPTSRALELLAQTHPTAPLRRAPAFVVLPDAAAELAARAAAVDARGGYVTARQAGGDEGGHALGVAALTARIAALIGFDDAAVAEAVAAALLHDAGLVFVPEAVRRMPPAAWGAPQRRRYEDHALLGEALLAPLAEPSLHLAIVAGEHHEAQDASGYPRRIGGGNRVLRPAGEKRALDRLALFSEVVAVADRYERLLAPAPGYAGRSPAAARLVLEAAAGTRLNREIVARFLASFPALPLGSEVRVAHGPLEGAYGVVYAISRRDPGRPYVRFYADADGRPMEPVEVELAGAPATVVTPVDDAA